MIRLSLVAFALAMVASGAQAQQAVRIGTEGAYAPYNFVDDSGKLAGFEIDLGNELCKRASLQCTFVSNEWDTIIPNLIAGNYDAIMAGMSITDERLQTIDFSDNYFPPDPSRYLAPAGATLDFDNLSGKKIGVQSGTIQAAYVQEELGSTNTVQAYDTADQALADLTAGNLDLIFADAPYVEPVATASNGTFELVGPEVLIGNGMGIGLRKGDAELKAKFNEAIAAAKADGTLDKLIAQWFEGRGPYFAQAQQ